MNYDISFRLALLAVMALTVSVTAYHRLQAAKTREKISRREEGMVFALVLRMIGLSLWLATLGYLVYPPTVAWAAIPLPTAVRWGGAVGGAVSAWLMLWTLTSLGKNLTDTVVTRRDATLVTHGPYRWVRHPFYVTAALTMLSATVLTANGLIGITSFLVLSLLAVRTPREEAKLLERFGQQYQEYRDQTGCFFPRLW